jgi:hypothetical protein
MSNIYLDAADAIRRAAKQFEVYTKAAEVLENAGSFVQAADEAKVVAAAAVAEREQAEADLAAAKASAKKIRDQSAELWSDAQEKAKRVVEEAVETAKVSAADIIRTAEGTATGIVANAQGHVRAAADKAQALEAQIEGLVTRTNALVEEIKAKEAKVTSLDSALAKLRSKLE